MHVACLVELYTTAVQRYYNHIAVLMDQGLSTTLAHRMCEDEHTIPTHPHWGEGGHCGHMRGLHGVGLCPKSTKNFCCFSFDYMAPTNLPFP